MKACVIPFCRFSVFKRDEIAGISTITCRFSFELSFPPVTDTMYCELVLGCRQAFFNPRNRAVTFSQSVYHGIMPVAYRSYLLDGGVAGARLELKEHNMRREGLLGLRRR